MVSALLRRAHATYAEVGGSNPRRSAGSIKCKRRGERGDGDAGDVVAGPRGEPRGALARYLSTTRVVVERFTVERFTVERFTVERFTVDDRTDWFNSSASRRRRRCRVSNRSVGGPLNRRWVRRGCWCCAAWRGGEESRRGMSLRGRAVSNPGRRRSRARALAALAALANSAPYFDGLTSAASQRLVAVFDVLHRRRRNARERGDGTTRDRTRERRFTRSDRPSYRRSGARRPRRWRARWLNPRVNAPSWCTRRCSEGTRFSRRFWTSFWIQLRIEG